MKGSFLPVLSLATAALVAVPTAPIQAIDATPTIADGGSALLARGGGGGGRGGGGRGGGGGGSRARTGFSGGGSFTRGDRAPSGGFSSGDRLNRVGNPSISRPSGRPDGFQRQGQGLQRADGGRTLGDRSGAIVDRNQPFNRQGTFNQGDRTFNQGDRTFNRDGDRTLNRQGDRTFNRDGDRNWNGNLGNRSVNIDRDWNREVNIGNINLNPGWARPGWGVARPWNWGWYGGWNTPTWGWWGASAAAWGIGTLASAAIINDAVNNAVSQNVTYITVPNTGYELQYGTIQPYGNYSVSFVVTANGTSYQITADCNAGAINGRQPSSAQEAELLNAACQVAYGNAS